MKDKVFIDTNIFVYSALDDEEEEDLHHSQLIEGRLRILNPFIQFPTDSS